MLSLLLLSGCFAVATDVSCTTNAGCTAVNTFCQLDPSSTTPSGVCKPKCDTAHPCALGSSCLPQTSGGTETTCLVQQGLGGVCGAAGYQAAPCQNGFICIKSQGSGNLGTCSQTCKLSETGSCGDGYQCASEQGSIAGEGKCKPLAAGQCLTNSGCAADSFCQLPNPVSTTTAGECKPKCDTAHPCDAGSSCVPHVLGGTDATCMALANENDHCGVAFPNPPCKNGLSCNQVTTLSATNSICQKTCTVSATGSCGDGFNCVAGTSGSTTGTCTAIVTTTTTSSTSTSSTSASFTSLSTDTGSTSTSSGSASYTDASSLKGSYAEPSNAVTSCSDASPTGASSPQGSYAGPSPVDALHAPLADSLAAAAPNSKLQDSQTPGYASPNSISNPLLSSAPRAFGLGLAGLLLAVVQ
jgi:hypothetical protein